MPLPAPPASFPIVVSFNTNGRPEHGEGTFFRASCNRRKCNIANLSLNYSYSSLSLSDNKLRGAGITNCGPRDNKLRGVFFRYERKTETTISDSAFCTQDETKIKMLSFGTKCGLVFDIIPRPKNKAGKSCFRGLMKKAKKSSNSRKFVPVRTIAVSNDLLRMQVVMTPEEINAFFYVITKINPNTAPGQPMIVRFNIKDFVDTMRGIGYDYKNRNACSSHSEPSAENERHHVQRW
jgi:hypothetical protein